MPARHLPLLSSLALALAACAPAGVTPRALAATLTQEALLLEMSGGQTCRLERAQAARNDASGWGGPVEGCAGVARIDVAFLRPGLLQRLTGTLRLDGFVAPPARVRVAGPDGRETVFASPPELPLTLEF